MSRDTTRVRVRRGDRGPWAARMRRPEGPRDELEGARGENGAAVRGENTPGTHRYRVRIVYTEPGFRVWNPDCPEEFSSEFVYAGARSPAEARRMALTEWDFCKCYSRVSWRRVIKSITVIR